jgi:hypothetical protein
VIPLGEDFPSNTTLQYDCSDRHLHQPRSGGAVPTQERRNEENSVNGDVLRHPPLSPLPLREGRNANITNAWRLCTPPSRISDGRIRHSFLPQYFTVNDAEGKNGSMLTRSPVTRSK